MQDINLIRKDIDIYRILNEIDTLLSTISDFDNQICIQGITSDMDPFYGSRRIDEMNHSEKDFKFFLFPELDYTNSIIEDMDLYRTRIMTLPKKCCLTYHSDPTMRVHIPLETNDQCFMLIDRTAHHLKDDGSAYLCDTTKLHTAINASLSPRTHLVGVTNENDGHN